PLPIAWFGAGGSEQAATTPAIAIPSKRVCLMAFRYRDPTGPARSASTTLHRGRECASGDSLSYGSAPAVRISGRCFLSARDPKRGIREFWSRLRGPFGSRSQRKTKVHFARLWAAPPSIFETPRRRSSARELRSSSAQLGFGPWRGSWLMDTLTSSYDLSE